MTIDNGNHLVLSGNRAVMAYLKRLGAQRPAGRARTAPISPSWTCATASAGGCGPMTGPCPGGSSPRDRRVPGTGPADYLPLAALLVRIPASASTR